MPWHLEQVSFTINKHIDSKTYFGVEKIRYAPFTIEPLNWKVADIQTKQGE